jgi:hypothetical protein
VPGTDLEPAYPSLPPVPTADQPFMPPAPPPEGGITPSFVAAPSPFTPPPAPASWSPSWSPPLLLSTEPSKPNYQARAALGMAAFAGISTALYYLNTTLFAGLLLLAPSMFIGAIFLGAFALKDARKTEGLSKTSAGFALGAGILGLVCFTGIFVLYVSQQIQKQLTLADLPVAPPVIDAAPINVSKTVQSGRLRITYFPGWQSVAFSNLPQCSSAADTLRCLLVLGHTDDLSFSYVMATPMSKPVSLAQIETNLSSGFAKSMPGYRRLSREDIRSGSTPGFRWVIYYTNEDHGIYATVTCFIYQQVLYEIDSVSGGESEFALRRDEIMRMGDSVQFVETSASRVVSTSPAP